MSTRKSLTTLLIICLIVVYFYFGSDYLKQTRHQAALARQLDDTTRALNLVPKPAQDIEKRLADAQQANQRAKLSLGPRNVNTTLIMDDIFRIADRLKIKLTPLSTETWRQKKVGENAYNMFQMEMRVESGFTDLLSFLRRLEDENNFPFLVVEKVSTNVANQNAATEGNKITTDVVIAIYTVVEGTK